MRYTLTILFLFLYYCVSAQQYLARNYSTQDGLPHPNVYRIYQDKAGFIWFCTDYGLSVCNGKSFNNVPTDSSGLLNTSVMSVFEDDDGNKYANTYKNGLFIISDSTVSTYPIDRGEYPASSLCAMKAGEIIWTIGKPFLYRVKNKQVTKCMLYGKTGKEVSFSNIVPDEHELIFCSDNGLYRSDKDTVKPFLTASAHDSIIDVARDKDIYWLGGKNRILKVRHDSILAAYHLNKGQFVKDILLDNNGDLWIALDGEGMLQIHNGVVSDITSKLTLNKTVVNDMLQDKEGNIWLATYGGGIFKISALNTFTYHLADNTPNFYCRALCGYGDNRLLLGSIGKIYLWDNGKIAPFAVSTLHTDQFIYFIKTIGHNTYIGTSLGLIIKNIASHNEILIKHTPAYAAISMLYDSLSDKIWIGDYASLYLLDHDTLIKDSTFFRGKHRYNCLLKEYNGKIWAGTDKGLLIYTPNNGLNTTWEPNCQVFDIKQDNSGRIWAATSKGLLYTEKSGYKLLKKTDGLPVDKCNRLAIDKNKLWVGTLAGICYIDLNTLKVYRYNNGLYSDDVQSLYFNDNTLYAGSVNRFISIDTREINVDTAPPLLYITSAKTSKNIYSNPTHLSLPYDNNKLEISFIALCYKAPDDVEYRYKITGLNETWSTTRNTSIDFSSLPSGEYTFILNARVGNGAWSKDKILNITIATPFWRQWWFVAIAILIIATTLLLIIRAWDIRRKKRISLRNKMLYLRQQALSALINPHFMFNCMNSIQYYLDANENDKANAYLADFAYLIRMTLDNAQKVYIVLESELARIRLYLSLEQLRFGDDLKYDIYIDTAIDTNDVYIPNMILQPYIENAIWHGIMPRNGKGKIWVSFRMLNTKELEMIIEDDGVGLSFRRYDEKIKEGHYGMSLTEERLRLMARLSNEPHSVDATEIVNDKGIIIGTKIRIIVTIKDEDISFSDDLDTI